MNYNAKRWACGLMAMLVLLLLAGTVFFVLRVHTVTINNWTNHDLRNVQVQASGKVFWRGDIPPRGWRWVFGTEPDMIVSDRDRKLTVSMTIDGNDIGHDFGYITAGESHYLEVTARDELKPQTFCRCFF